MLMIVFKPCTLFGDKGEWTNGDTPETRASLQEQVIAQSTVNGVEIRTLTASAINYPTQLGWFMDMPERGERITRKSVGLFEHMAFFYTKPGEQNGSLR